MNRGLKSYAKSISLVVGNAASINININKNDANLHIELPLISSVGQCKIETSLVFSLLNKSEKGLFGNGFKLNFYNKIEKRDSYVEVKNHDGSCDKYESDSSFYNKETELKVEEVSDDNYGANHFEIKDKYSNTLEFNDLQDYPCAIYYKNGDSLSLDFVSTDKTIKNEYGDKIVFSKSDNEFITKAKYYHNETLIVSAEILYDLNGRISKVTHKNGDAIMSSVSLNISENEILVKDDISGHRIKFKMENDRVSSYIDGYDDIFSNSYENKIEYHDGYSCLIGRKNRKLYRFFDSNDLPMYEMDDKGNVSETEYDKESKLLLYSSGMISLNNLNNLLSSSDISLFESDGPTVLEVEQSDSLFKNILGDKAYKIFGSGTLKKTISISGLPTDDALAILFVKQLTPKTETSYVEIALTSSGVDREVLSKTTIDNLFELVTLGVSAKESFDSIKLSITLVGDAQIEIGCVKIVKKDFASFYEYDSSGNATELTSGNGYTSFSYDKNNYPTRSIGVDSVLFNYEYDNYGNLKKVTTAYGAKIENTYDSTYKSNLLSNKTSSKDGNRILETAKEYTADGRFVSFSKNELGDATCYEEYDSFGRVTRSKNPLNVINRRFYNDDGTMNEISINDTQNSAKLSYKYDEKKRVSKVIADNGSTYDFSYDDFNNISEIDLNNHCIFKYEYDLESGNLTKQKYGESSDAYIFEYNGDDLLSNIYYEDTNGNKTLKYRYFYNVSGQLTKVADGDSNTLNKYSYDDGRLTKSECDCLSVENSYDNLNNVNFKSVTASDGNARHFLYDTVSRSKGSHPNSLYDALKKTNAYLGIFESDASLRCYLHNELIYPINHNGEKIEPTISQDGAISYVKVGAYNRLSYCITDSSHYNAPCGGVHFWFKPGASYSSSNKEYLFSLRRDNTKYRDFIGVYTQNKRVYLEVTDYEGNSYELIKSDFEIDSRGWNFISLNFMNRCDGYGYADMCEYILMLNSHQQSYKKADPRLLVDPGVNQVFNMGHKFDGSTCSCDFSGNIACLAIGRADYLTLEDAINYYRLTKDYIIDNGLVDEEVDAVDFSQTTILTSNQDVLKMFDIYPLQNSVTSLKGNKPIKFNLRNLSDFDKDRTFNFNNKSKGYSYVADGEELIYDFGISDNGTIAFRAYTDVSDVEQYFFEAKDSKGNRLALYRSIDKYLVVDINGKLMTTTLKFENGDWHSVTFSFKIGMSSASQSEEDLNLRIYLDGKRYVRSISVSFEYSGLSFSIGRKFSKVSVSSYFSIYYTSHPFFGQIEMLATRPSYCEESTIVSLLSNLSNLKRISEFDDLGMLRKIDVHKDGLTILSNIYSYKRCNDKVHISNRVEEETIRYGDTIRSRKYETDSLGNVTRIEDYNFGSHEYKYDYRGFLIKDDDKEYSYDKNGNIIQKGSDTLTYDSIIKDRLVSFNETKVEYGSSNLLNPVKFGAKLYTYEGKRLVTYSDGSETWEYTYNDQGLRIKKKNSQGLTTIYGYDGDRLIHQETADSKLDFLYDEYGFLFGVVKDNSERFFYIRDCLQNIIGIVNENGTLVAKYIYDAWGKITSIETLSSSIGELNPFRYKGYYYDVESEMYYCKSRYYVPLWGRWLNADNPNYLSFDQINGSNAFSYCGNNPVMGIDKYGKFWFELCTIAVGAICGMVSCAVSAAITGEQITWKNVVSAGIGGAVSSAIILATKGTGLALASYASALAESASNEFFDYLFGDKEFSTDNIVKSIGHIAVDTAVNGTISYVSGEFVKTKFPCTKTNSGWRMPQSVSSYFGKAYGQKLTAGAVLGSCVSTGIGLVVSASDMVNRAKKIFDDFADNYLLKTPEEIFG